MHVAIYASKDVRQPIDTVFLRLRSITKNIWHEKPFIVAIKQTELKEVGKRSFIPLKKQFDTEQEAKDFIQHTYADQFIFLYEFNRRGWQYDMDEHQVDLEEIEGLYSIEFKSPTEQGLKDLLLQFNAKDVIKGPSVVAIKNLLGR